MRSATYHDRMRRLRAIPATLALFGLMFPWARLVVTSLHLAEGHHDLVVAEPAATERSAATIAEAFHGHHHADDATRHDHPLVACDFSAQRSRVIQAIALPAALPTIFAMLVPSQAPAHPLSRNAGVRDHGPPGALLPAILRI